MPNYEEDKNLCKKFLESFISKDSTKPKYASILQPVANRQILCIDISLEDVRSFDASLYHSIMNNTNSYTRLFLEVIDEILPPSEVEQSVNDGDALDVFIYQRKLLSLKDDTNENSVARTHYPPELIRRYELRFSSPFNTRAQAIRSIKALSIGGFVNVRGIVIKSTEIKAKVVVNTYTCDRCNCEIYQEVKDIQYMPLTMCASDECVRNGVTGNLFLQVRASKLVKYQEIRLQELSHQVPVGHTPRSITVHAIGELSRIAGPGDVVNVAGVFLPLKLTGFAALRQGLLSDTFILAHQIEKTKSYDKNLVNTETQLAFDSLVHDLDRYNKLSSSIAPEIYGHEDVKRALLLQLIGGVNKDFEQEKTIKTPEDDNLATQGDITGQSSLKIRGDINICLMGDPGVAKSQLLKFISAIVPRGVYTTGKGSSGVGLTASVTRDTLTGEFLLEGGALVLADKGICCIDEFDKMEETDRVAIHEVMEQQTVSIAKAGIITTLNARTSVLAAANPLYGKYNLKKSVAQNINLPAALLSRFDLLFLILDFANPDRDMKLAEHVSYVHTYGIHPPLGFEALTPELIRLFISKARSINPLIPKDVSEHIINIYVNMRIESDKQSLKKNEQNSLYVTARTLLAILRLSTAMARVRLSDIVEKSDVEEAVRLIESSKLSLDPQFRDDIAQKHKAPEDSIFDLIKDLLSNNASDKKIAYNEAQTTAIRSGFTNEQFLHSIKVYQDLGIWLITENNKDIILLSSNI